MHLGIVRTCALSCLLCASTASNSWAVLLAYEGFSYAPGTLSGKGLPTDPGFSTSWTQSGANGGNVVAAGLGYGVLQTSGGALNLAGAGTTLNFRQLSNIYDAPADSATGDIWFSYLVLPGAFTGAPFAGMSLYSDAISGTAAADQDFGVATRNDGGNFRYAFSDFDITATFINSTVQPTNGATVLIVGHVDFGAGSNINANTEDLFEYFVNPHLDGNPLTPVGSASFTANFRTIRMAAASGAPFTVDEFRLGESYADVVPLLVPEAGAIGCGCVSLIIGALIGYCRKTRRTSESE